MKANLGCGKTILPGWDNVDIVFPDGQPDGTIMRDLSDYLQNIPKDYLEEVRAHHVLEHVVNLDEVMKYLWGACRNGAKIDIIVPLGNTLWDVADPTHVRKFNHKTIEYYCKGFQTSYSRPQYFELLSQHIEREGDDWFEGIQWIVANLHIILRVVK